MHIPETQTRVKALMDRLAADPPQVLLLEGGDAAEREALALYWAARLNCRCGGPACGDCPACVQVRDKVHTDLRICDGREGKIKIDEIRELKPLFGQPPRGDGKRVVIFAEAQELTPQAANALLKSLEEPSRGTVFALLTPQREWLLPTLVSRSWVLTLAWPSETVVGDEVRQWKEGLMTFWRTGKGWFKLTSAKGAVDKDLAMNVILACQHEVVHTMTGAGGPNGGSDMSASFAKVPPAALKKIDLALAHAQDALSIPTPVNPALVLDWLATRVYAVVRGR